MDIRKASYRFWKGDSRRKVSWIEDYIDHGSRVLDIGAGPCFVTSILRDLGHDVTGLDIADRSVVKNATPVIYDGVEIPFGEDEFDASLLLTVLHHVRDPDALLEEAKRVSKNIIVVEDIHNNPFQGMVVKTLDSLINLEFFDHPHNNMVDAEWREMFKDRSLKILDTQFHKIAGFLTQGVYHLSAQRAMLQ